MTSEPISKEAEDVTVYIGEIGRYQWRVFIVVFILTIFTTDSIHIVFIGADMDHWCHVPELDSLPAGVQKNISIPAVERSEDGRVLEYSKCEMYARNYSYYVLYNDSQFVVSTDNNTDDFVSCSHGWVYNTSLFQSTIVKKFNLVCDLSFLKPFVSTVYMLGILLGSVSSGALSDRFGRKKIMIAYCLIKIVGILMSIFSSNYIMFVIGRLLMGCGNVGYALPSFVLVMELVGRRYRTVLGTSLQIAFSVGYMLQPVVAYFLRDELTFQVAVCSPVVLFPFLMFFLLPESPRWLVIHGKFDEVTKLVENICETNNRQLSKHFNPTSLLQQVLVLVLVLFVVVVVVVVFNFDLSRIKTELGGV